MPEPEDYLCATCTFFVEKWQTEHWLDCEALIAPNFKSLKQSASQGCRLCRLVYQACIYEGYEKWLSEINEPITLEAFMYSQQDNVASSDGQADDESSDSSSNSPSVVDGQEEDESEMKLRVSIHSSGCGFELWTDGLHGKPTVWRGPVVPKPVNHLQQSSAATRTLDYQGLSSITSLAQTWVSDCLKHHPNCASYRNADIHSEKVYPTRLVHVGSGDHKDPAKLVIPNLTNQDHIEYVALSYAWGPNTAWSKTTASNISQMTKAFDWPSLPNTIRDAIVFTRMLGYKYIWIDALCIIQSEGPNDAVHQADWNREAARFGDYYQNAVLTIAATGADSSNKGLFLDRPGFQYDTKPLMIGRRLRSKHKMEISVYPAIPLWKTEIEQSPLHVRGWASQERILSQRILHFAANCVLWECRQCRATEVNHRFLWSVEEAGAWPGEDFVSAYRIQNALAKDIHKILWPSFVNSYSNKEFSFTSDRLPALSGIAAGVNARIGQTYLAGIWEESLAEGLGWMVNGRFQSNKQASRNTTEKQPGSLRTPTWSWACARGSVDFLCTLGHWTTLMQLVSQKVIVQGSPTSGQMTEASLYVRGTIQTFNFSDLGLVLCADENKENTLEPEPDPSRWRRDKAVYLDNISAKEIVYKSVVCFLVGKVDLLPIYKGGGIEVGGALILEPTGLKTGLMDTFRRIGFSCLPFLEYWSKAQEERVITIV